jgi:AcrR family transcriptional regulator
MAEAVRNQSPDQTLAESRRHQIFLAACRVLARKSFHEASVKELALEAGIAAGSIYLYLRSKDEILVLIAESMVGELVEQLPAIRERSDGDPRRELVEMMSTIIDVIDRYRDAFNVLHHEGRYLEQRTEYKQAIARASGPYRQAVATVLERGRELGLINFIDAESAVHIIHMLCAGWAMHGRSLRGIGKETYKREVEAILEGRFFAPAPRNRNGNGAAPR